MSQSRASSNDSAVLIDSIPPTPENKNKNERRQRRQGQNGDDDDDQDTTTNSATTTETTTSTILSNIQLCAVSLSETMTKSALSGLATTGLLASAIAPRSVVAVTSLVAEAQTQAVVNVASHLLVHIPSDTASMELMKKLVSSYAVANPACLQSFAAMSSTQIALTSAFGGALPLLVAAALQESIEVSKLVSGKSTHRQFFISSGEVAAQVGGGLAGLAAGAVAGSMLLPGLGTGIGSIVGSYAGASMMPWVFNKVIVKISPPSSSSSSQKLLENNNNNNNNENNGKNEFHFYWTEKETDDGFVLINYSEDCNDDDDDYDDVQQNDQINEAERLSPEEQRQKRAQATFVETAKALLSRATVVPVSKFLESLKNNNNNNNDNTFVDVVESLTSSQATLERIFSAAASSRNFGSEDHDENHQPLQQLGTVLMIRATPSTGKTTSSSSVASLSRQNRDHDEQEVLQDHPRETHQMTPSRNSSRIFLDNNNNDNNNDAASNGTVERQQQVSADIGGQMWSVRQLNSLF